MQINEKYHRNDSQQTRSSMAILDIFREIGGPHSPNVTSQWLLCVATSYSSQYTIVPLLIYDLSLDYKTLMATLRCHQL